jgi:ribosomal protein S18 acetylase RimI-like enzyme
VNEACRRATAGDVPRIAELARELRTELEPMKGGAIWARREARAEPLEDGYEALLARDDACVLVGTIDDTVIGFGTVVVEALRDGGNLGVIDDLYVDPEARSVGVGEELVNALIAFCDEHECVGIDALALPGHRATKNFFEENGFTARALVMHRRPPT